MRNFFTSRAFYILTAIFFAIVLFFNANSIAVRNQGSSSSGEVYTASINNVPIELKYDNSKYFVSGYTATANVYLTGYNRLQIANEQNADTRNFYLTADLTHASAGTVQVPIKVNGLASGINATVAPTSLSVNIEPKETRSFDLSAPIAPSQLADGFKVLSTDLSSQTVKVTAGDATLNQIKAVEAVLPTNTLLSDDFSDNVNLRALDESGKSLQVQFSPNTVKLTVKLDKPSKTVPVTVKRSGSLASSLSDMNLDLQTKTVLITGSKEALAKVDSVTATVDVSGITESVTRHVHVSADGDVTVNPSSVDVKLTPVKK